MASGCDWHVSNGGQVFAFPGCADRVALERERIEVEPLLHLLQSFVNHVRTKRILCASLIMHQKSPCFGDCFMFHLYLLLFQDYSSRVVTSTRWTLSVARRDAKSLIPAGEQIFHWWRVVPGMFWLPVLTVLPQFCPTAKMRLMTRLRHLYHKWKTALIQRLHMCWRGPWHPRNLCLERRLYWCCILCNMNPDISNCISDIYIYIYIIS